MRIARVIGTVVMNRKAPELKPGRYVIAHALDEAALDGLAQHDPRSTPMPEALVVFDQSGAGVGQLIAVSEGAEATMPFYPDPIPIDAYAAAIIDTVQLDHQEVIAINA